MADGIIIDTPKEHELVDSIERLEKKMDALMVLVRDLVKAAKPASK
jgi:hypothetical protein